MLERNKMKYDIQYMRIPNIRNWIFCSLTSILIFSGVCSAEELILDGHVLLDKFTNIDWMDYDKVQNIINSNNSYSLSEFPLSINEFGIEGDRNRKYQLAKSSSSLYLPVLHSPHWIDDTNIVYLDLINSIVKVKKYNLVSMSESDILEHKIDNKDNCPSIGAVLTYLPQYSNGILIIHKSFAQEDYDGWGHMENKVGETFEIYLFNLEKTKIESIGTIIDKNYRSGPPVPNAFMHIRPKRNQVLLELQGIGYYLIDLTEKNVKKIRVMIKNPEALDALRCSEYSSRRPLISIKSYTISTSFPKNIKWSRDGTRLSLDGGLFVIDCP